MRHAVLALLLSASVWAQPATRIFQLNNRPAAATLDVVRQQLTPQGTVFADERLNKLIVRDSPEALQRVADLLAQIDQPAPQVRLKVSFQGANPSSATVLAAGGTQRGGGLAANAYTRDASINAQQNLLVMSGEKGHILVGQNLPYVQPWLGLVPAGVVFQTVSTGFAVEPVVVGDNVRVKVTPWISYISPNGPGQIEFAESASTLNLKSGETVMLSSGSSTRTSSGGGLRGGGGAITNGSDTRGAFALVLANGSSSQTDSMSIWLTAQVEPDYSR